MTVGQRQPVRPGQSAERVRSRIRDRFGLVFLLLVTTVFFSIPAPNAKLVVACDLRAPSGPASCSLRRPPARVPRSCG